MLEDVEAELNEEREQASWHRSLEDQRRVVEVEAAQDWLTKPAGPDERGEGSRGDIDHSTRLDPGENSGHGQRKKHLAQLSLLLEAECLRRLAELLGN